MELDCGSEFRTSEEGKMVGLGMRGPEDTIALFRSSSDSLHSFRSILAKYSQEQTVRF